jgi:hypothetical protein
MVAEVDRRRVAAVIAADAHLEVGARRAAALDSHLDQLADALLVDRLERVFGDDLLVDVVGQEPADVVARVAERHLREVVGAERKELGMLGDLLGDERRARDFDHLLDPARPFAAGAPDEATGRRGRSGCSKA